MISFIIEERARIDSDKVKCIDFGGIVHSTQRPRGAGGMAKDALLSECGNWVFWQPEPSELEVTCPQCLDIRWRYVGAGR